MCKKAGVPLPDFDGITGAVAQIGDCFHVYIASDMDNPVDIVDTIIHESVHVVQGLKTFIGEETPGREFEAYTTAHVATTLMQEYERLSNGKDMQSVPKSSSDKPVLESSDLSGWTQKLL